MVSFGPINGATVANAIFSAAQAGGANGNQLVVDGLNRDIQRIQGFRTVTSQADNQRLAELRAEIQAIENSATPIGFEDQTKARRVELYTQAYRILGKTYVDIEGDVTLSRYKDQIDALLEPRLVGAKKTRLDQLRSLEAQARRDFFASGSETIVRRLNNLAGQISQLVPPRLIGELSASERQQYDRLVSEANAYAGTEVFLPSTKMLKIENLQRTIGRIAQGAPSPGILA